MDSTVLPPPLCPPASAGVGTAPAPPARTLRIRVNPACISRAAAASSKKPTWPGSSRDEKQPAKRRSEAVEGKENNSAPASAKISTLLRPCSRGDEAPRSPPGNRKRRHGGAADGYSGAGAAPAPVAKRKATAPDSEQAKKRASPSRIPIASKRRVGGQDSASASPSPRSSGSGGTVRALLARARPASDAIRRRDIQRLRAEARRELERVVRTVEFNDPFSSPQDVLGDRRRSHPLPSDSAKQIGRQ